MDEHRKPSNIRTWLQPVAGLIVVAAIICGLAIDAKSFLVNALAALSAMVVTFWIGTTIVERYVRAQRQQQWERVQFQTLRAVAVHLCEIAGTLFLHYPGIASKAVEPLWQAHNAPLNPHLGDAFDAVLGELETLPSSEYLHKSTSDCAVEYYAAVTWDLDQIQNVLTPRILESPAEQYLIDRLVDFDDARRELHHSIIAHQQAVTQSVFPRVVFLVNRAKQLHQELCRQVHLANGGSARKVSQTDSRTIE